MDAEEFRKAAKKMRTTQDADKLWAQIASISPDNLKQRQELGRLLVTACKDKGIPGIKGGYE